VKVDTDELRISVESVDIHSDPDELLEILTRVENLLQVAKSLDMIIKDRLVSWIRHNGPLHVTEGESYIVQDSSRTTCIDKERVLVSLLEVTGGDVEGLLAYLVAQPFKPGACRNALPSDVYEDTFQTTYSGKPQVCSTKS